MRTAGSQAAGYAEPRGRRTRNQRVDRRSSSSMTGCPPGSRQSAVRRSPCHTRVGTTLPAAYGLRGSIARPRLHCRSLSARSWQPRSALKTLTVPPGEAETPSRTASEPRTAPAAPQSTAARTAARARPRRPAPASRGPGTRASVPGGPAPSVPVTRGLPGGDAGEEALRRVRGARRVRRGQTVGRQRPPERRDREVHAQRRAPVAVLLYGGAPRHRCGTGERRGTRGEHLVDHDPERQMSALGLTCTPSSPRGARQRSGGR
ncbi:hypothetical protein STANM309S_02835 [Streptomyces tanashiensis]